MPPHSRSRAIETSPLAGAVLVFIVACVFYLPSLGKSPFSSRGEAREAVVVFNMLEQQNFILPLRNGADIPSKPPLFHWLGSLFSLLGIGSEEFAIRLPSGLAAALCAALLFYFVARTEDRLGKNKALFAAIILGTSAEWLRSGSLARVDMVFTALCTAATLWLFSAVREWAAERHGLGYVLWGSAAMALAVLTKGPAGIALPWAVVFLYAVLFTRLKHFRLLPAALSVILAACAAGVWYWAAWRQGGERFLDVHLMRENIARIFGSERYLTGHSSPFYSTVLLLISGFLPWSVFLPIAGALLWTKRKALRILDDQILLLSLVWVGVYVIFFSLTSSKRSVYLLPAFPAMAYLIASICSDAFGAVAEFRRSRYFAVAILSLLSVLLFGTSVFALLYSPQLFEQMPFLNRLKPGAASQAKLVLTLLSSRHLIPAAIALSGALAIRAAGELRSSRVDGAVLSTAGATLILSLTVNYAVMPQVSLNNSPVEFVGGAIELVPEGKTLHEFKRELYSAIFYAKRNLPFTDVVPVEADGSDAYLLVTGEDLAGVRAQSERSDVLLISPNPAFQGREVLVLVKAKAKPGIRSSGEQDPRKDDE